MVRRGGEESVDNLLDETRDIFRRGSRRSR